MGLQTAVYAIQNSTQDVEINPPPSLPKHDEYTTMFATCPMVATRTLMKKKDKITIDVCLASAFLHLFVIRTALGIGILFPTKCICQLRHQVILQLILVLGTHLGHGKCVPVTRPNL